MIKIRPLLRTRDNYGDGCYGASRGEHTHAGEDFAVLSGSEVELLESGTVTKLGYCYGDDLSYRYVQVSHGNGYVSRYLYVAPGVDLRQRVEAGNVIGVVQDLDKRYPGITPHIHFEVRLNGKIIPPRQYFDRIESQ